jgi:hypothetical protein
VTAPGGAIFERLPVRHFWTNVSVVTSGSMLSEELVGQLIRLDTRIVLSEPRMAKLRESFWTTASLPLSSL